MVFIWGDWGRRRSRSLSLTWAIVRHCLKTKTGNEWTKYLNEADAYLSICRVLLSKIFKSEPSPSVKPCFLHTGSSQLCVCAQENRCLWTKSRSKCHNNCASWHDHHSLSAIQKDSMGVGSTRVALEMFNSQQQEQVRLFSVQQYELGLLAKPQGPEISKSEWKVTPELGGEQARGCTPTPITMCGESAVNLPKWEACTSTWEVGFLGCQETGRRGLWRHLQAQSG